LGGNLVALNQFPDLKSSEPFDERRPGLDHLAFACVSVARFQSPLLATRSPHPSERMFRFWPA
jgi:hypothetical protein